MNSPFALVFPGQGAQRVGMGQSFANAEPYQRFLAQADALFPGLREIISQGPAERLTETEVAQPALLTVALGMFESLRPQLAYPPVAVAGHSLGEYTALVVAGALTFEQAFQLVHLRGQLMQQACQLRPGGMAAVLKADRDLVESVLQEPVFQGQVVIGNYNSPDQLVISGEQQLLEAASQTLKERGVRRVVPLKVSGAFHSPLMASAHAELALALQATCFRDAEIPVITNVDGLPTTRADQLKDKLLHQLLSPVQWEQTAHSLAALAPRLLEVGPAKVVGPLLVQTRSELTSELYAEYQSL